MARFITFGEIMLRLKSNHNERLFQSPTLEATFGGGEANVAVGLARFGLDTAFISIIPDNMIGDACIQELRKQGVDTTYIVRRGGRIGLYYLEAGSNQRPSIVIYDRANSAISEVNLGLIDWEKVFSGTKWYHFTGITPAISLSASEVVLESAKVAKEKKVTISCDLNYRNSLWQYGKKAPEVMPEIVRYADIIVGNEEDCQKALGFSVNVDIESGKLDLDKYQYITEAILEEYANIKKIAITMRESHSANHNGWSAVLHNREEFIVSRKYEIFNIVDRVGTGDAFAAGLIYGLNQLDTDREALDFAVATSCLKHTIVGDLPLLNVGEVNKLLISGGSGRVQR